MAVFNLRPILLLLLSCKQVFSWNHEVNTPFCTPTGQGTCNFGWEQFASPQGAEFNWQSAWVYDHTCAYIANSNDWEPFYMVPNYYNEDGESGAHDTLFHIDCSPLGYYNVIMTNIEVSAQGGLSPVFWYAGSRFGGSGGCSCGDTGLDPQGMWACQCAFDCSKTF